LWFPHQGTIGLSSVATFVILKFVDLVVGVRVSGEDELRGLDLSQHSEEAYSMEIDLHPVVHPAHELPQPAIASAAAANRSGVKDKCGGSGIGPPWDHLFFLGSRVRSPGLLIGKSRICRLKSNFGIPPSNSRRINEP